MQEIKIKLGSREYEIACPEESREHIHSLAEKLNMQIKKFQDANPASSFDFAMAITALNLLEAKDNVSQEQLGEDLEEAVKIASEKAANKARAEIISKANHRINQINTELNKSKSDLENSRVQLEQYKKELAQHEEIKTELEESKKELAQLKEAMHEKSSNNDSSIEGVYNNLQNLLVKLG